MAIRNEDKQWIYGEIQSAIGSLRPHGWRKAVSVLRELGILGAIITVIVALLGITAAAVYHAVADVREETALRTRTGDRLEKIESTLNLLTAQLAAQKYSTIPPKELKNHREELKDIRDNLAKARRDTPGYWPATFQIITLFSKASSDIEKVAEQPEGSFDTIVNDQLGAVAPVENSRIVLKNLIQGMIFKNSIVRFDPSVRLVNDVFINCVFIFPAAENPPKPLQEIGKTLLASDLSKVTLNAS